MLLNYLTIAWRNLLRNKLFSSINILGLSSGIACCILIALYVFHETSYDRFHQNADRIVRASMQIVSGGKDLKIAVTGTKVLPEFKRLFPEVENGVRFFPTNAIVSHEGKTFREKGLVYVDSTLFDVFSFQLIAGDARTALDKPDQLVITTSIAQKYFEDGDAVGKMLQINNKEFLVTGVVEDCPANSQIKFEMLGSWASLTDPVYVNESWFDASHYTYLLLKEPSTHDVLQAKINSYFEKFNDKFALTIQVQPLTDVHLYAIAEGGFEPGGDYRYVYIFSIIAFVILAVACANYVNLTTARASERAKEVGLRKVIGATRNKLMVQFTGESIVIVCISLLIAFLFADLLLPVFNTIAAKKLSLNVLFHPWPFLVLSGIVLFIGFLGSLYPSLVLSGFKPVSVLKGNFSTGTTGIGLRRSLIILQFIISVSLIASTLMIQRQLSFIQNKKLGYNKDHVMVLQSDRSVVDKMETIKERFQKSPEVIAVSTCNQTPVFIPGKYNLVVNEEELLVTAVRVDRDFIKTMGLTLQVGGDFTLAEQEAAFAGTDTIQRPIMLNETAVRSFGWTAEQALGKTLKFQGRNSIVKAVVGDFHFSSMHEPIGPFVIFLASNTSKILIKISGRRIPETVEHLKEQWATVAPHLTFDYEFLDDQFNQLYNAETRTGKLFYGFAVLGIVLASLGILGLVTFTAEQRTKEIGIRKVLGASVLSVIALLSKDLLKLIGIATIIALPLSWWLTDQWLQSFAYRTPMDVSIFVLSGSVSIIIACFLLGMQASKAALANPVDSLRNE
jgi:putative ABC transport system permease protein